jgi:hypothetical protein
MKPRRSSVGFQGGQVLSLRLSQEALESLREAMRGNDPRWHEVDATDGAVLLDLEQVVYLRTESDEQHIGF